MFFNIGSFFSDDENTEMKKEDKLNNHSKDQTSDFSQVSYAKPHVPVTNDYSHNHHKVVDHVKKIKNDIDRVDYQDYIYYDDDDDTDLSASTSNSESKEETDYYYYDYDDFDEKIDRKDGDDEPEYEYFYYYVEEFVDPKDIQSANNIERLPKPSYQKNVTEGVQ